MSDAARDFLGELSRREQRGAPQSLRRSTVGAFASPFNGGFAGGKRDRLTDDWDPGALSPNTIHRAGGALLRDRARDLVLNNPLAESGVDAYIANVIECGITPKPLFPDADRRRLWLNAWNAWGGMTAAGSRESDLTGQQTTYELLALWLEEIITAGGCLLRFVELPRAKRRLPLALELIPEERFADELDTPFATTNRKTANAVRRGVEVDTATGRPVAYWIRPYLPNDPSWDFSWEPIRVPAEQCEYAFFRRRIGQNRGHSLLCSAIMWLWKLGYYTDNELMNSAVKSCFSAMVTQGDDSDEFPTLSDDDPDGPLTDAVGNLMEKLQPGVIFRGRKGEKIEGVGPNTPGGDATPWIMLIERSIGMGMGLSYEELCRDYSQGSFSSTRASANSDRKRFRRMQRFTVNHFCNPVYRRFAAAAARAGLDGFPRPSEFLPEIDDWLAVAWQPPGWASVNPLDDAQAATVEITHGLATRAQYIANKGGDWEEVYEQLDREQARQEELGLVFAGDVPATAAPGTSPGSQRQNEKQSAAAPPANKSQRTKRGGAP